MGDLLGNIAFVVVALLGWIISEAIKRREAREQAASQGAPRLARRSAPEAGTGEVDVIYGRRAVPEALTAPPPAAPAAPAAGRGAASGRLSAPAAPMSLESDGALVSLTGSGLDSRISTSRPMAMARQRLGRTGRAWTRLGVPGRTGRRRAVRQGILWSEVLGSPRAHRGPHRSPVQRRAADLRGGS